MHPLEPPLVMVADGDARAAGTLAAALRREGMRVITCRRAAAAVDAVAFHRPSVVAVRPSGAGAARARDRAPSLARGARRATPPPRRPAHGRRRARGPRR